jgi:ribA/ribD-fused uncharacterized protein
MLQLKVREFRDRFSFLSNFEGGVEQKYQAAKCVNEEDREKILKMMPGQSKRAGQKVKIREDWEDVKLDIMYQLVKEKFSRGPFRTMLLRTENMILEEGNNWGDKFWGVSLKTGKGENNLGKILMRVREELKK